MASRTHVASKSKWTELRRAVLGSLIWFVWAWLPARAVRAEDPAGTPPATPDSAQPNAAGHAAIPLSLTVSGGVSLGAFEAGVLYFIGEGVKHSDGEVELRIATGASAGSANSLIALIDSCSPHSDDPSRSLGFQTWVPVGIGQLFDPQSVTATAVFTREPLVAAMQRVGRRWREGLRSDCDVVLGVSVTRSTPQLIALTKTGRGPGVQVPRSAEKFVVRMRGRGLGRMPWVGNYVDTSATVAQPLLALSTAEDDASQSRNFDRVLELLYASTAFPLAFAPYNLEYCETAPAERAGLQPGANPFACDRPHSAQFVDGGLFDNSPLRLNRHIVLRNLRKDAAGRARWLELSEPATGTPPMVRYSYVDPSASGLPAPDLVPGDTSETSALDMLSALAANFVESSRRRELLAVLEDADPHDGLRGQMHLTHNQLPPIAGQLGAFFGFFERDFRAFDFYLGMYDGLVSLRSVLEDVSTQAQARARLAAHFPVLQKPLRNDLPQGMRPFACLLSQVDPDYAEHASACDADELRNFRILIQVTLDRLHDACSRLEASALSPYAAPLCLAAASGKPRVHARGVVELPPQRVARAEEEDDFTYTLRLLGDYHFTFHDLGLKADEARYGRTKIRRALLSMSDALAAAQPSRVSEAIIATVGRIGANQLLYEPPRSLLYLTAGTTVEVGTSLLPFSWNESWARLNLALQLSRWQTMVTPGRVTVAVTPLIGPELELLALSSFAVQAMLGARIGWQVSWADNAGFGSCSNVQAFNDARNCSQLIAQGYVALAIIERLRAQLVLETFPTAQRAAFRSRIAFQLSFGLQLF